MVYLPTLNLLQTLENMQHKGALSQTFQVRECSHRTVLYRILVQYITVHIRAGGVPAN